MWPPHFKRLGLKHVIVHFRNDFTQRQVIHNTFGGEGAALPTRTSGARARLFFLNFAYCCGPGAGGGSNRCWIRSWGSRSLRLASAPCTLRAAATCKPWLLFLRMWMNLHAGMFVSQGHRKILCTTPLRNFPSHLSVLGFWSGYGRTFSWSNTNCLVRKLIRHSTIVPYPIRKRIHLNIQLGLCCRTLKILEITGCDGTRRNNLV